MTLRRREGNHQSRGDVQSVRRALAILQSFAHERRDLGVNELAVAHGLHPSTISRLLATLASAGFVRVSEETGRYRLGLAPLELAGLVLLQMDVRSIAQPIMRDLAARCQEAVNLSVLDAHEVVIVEQVPVPRLFRYVSWVGRRIPVHVTAHGKAHLAFQSVQTRHAVLDAIADRQGNLPGFTDRSITSRAAFEAELAAVAIRGYATSHREMEPDLSAVAVPVFDHTGLAIAALAVPGHSSRFDDGLFSHLAALAVDAGRRISAELGGHGTTRPTMIHEALALAPDR